VVIRFNHGDQAVSKLTLRSGCVVPPARIYSQLSKVPSMNSFLAISMSIGVFLSQTAAFGAEAQDASTVYLQCAVGTGCSSMPTTNVMAIEVPVERNAPQVPGHPLTSVVVTQCSMLVAVYMTMPDGRLLRFDKSSSLPADQLLTMAYAAVRSERVEVSCDSVGAVGYETHDPV
jgi:hypothetical protein